MSSIITEQHDVEFEGESVSAEVTYEWGGPVDPSLVNIKSIRLRGSEIALDETDFDRLERRLS